jgi:hypothetical protein
MIDARGCASIMTSGQARAAGTRARTGQRRENEGASGGGTLAPGWRIPPAADPGRAEQTDPGAASLG